MPNDKNEGIIAQTVEVFCPHCGTKMHYKKRLDTGQVSRRIFCPDCKCRLLAKSGSQLIFDAMEPVAFKSEMEINYETSEPKGYE